MAIEVPKTTVALEDLNVSQEFLARYNRPGPRYTSYPTAPLWKEDFGPHDMECQCAQAEGHTTPISIHAHIPFCENLCLFCGCNVSIQKDKSGAIPYLDSL